MFSFKALYSANNAVDIKNNNFAFIKPVKVDYAVQV